MKQKIHEVFSCFSEDDLVTVCVNKKLQADFGVCHGCSAFSDAPKKLGEFTAFTVPDEFVELSNRTYSREQINRLVRKRKGLSEYYCMPLLNCIHYLLLFNYACIFTFQTGKEKGHALK